MDVKFILKAECRINDIDYKARTITEIEKELEDIFKDIGIMTSVIIGGLTYIDESEVENETGSSRDKYQGTNPELDQQRL